MDKDNQKYNKFSDRRKFARIPVNSKVNYFLIVKSIKKMGKGNGTVVNISQSGMMLQTDHKITSNYIYLVYKDSDDKKIGMIGKIVFFLNCIETDCIEMESNFKLNTRIMLNSGKVSYMNFTWKM